MICSPKWCTLITNSLIPKLCRYLMFLQKRNIIYHSQCFWMVICKGFNRVPSCCEDECFLNLRFEIFLAFRDCFNSKRLSIEVVRSWVTVTFAKSISLYPPNLIAQYTLRCLSVQYTQKEICKCSNHGQYNH